MFGASVNSKKRGDIGVGSAIGWATRMGFTVSIPLTDSQDYDLIIDDGVRVLRVQVKTCSYRQSQNGLYNVGLKVSGGNRSGSGKVKRFDPSRVDALYVLVETGVEYFIPVFHGMPTISLTLNERFDAFRVGNVVDKLVSERP